jgi:hypothetical protein
LTHRTLNQVKKMLKRKETHEMHISQVQYHATKEIWDIDYMSTSDEEDNDSEPEEPPQEEEGEEGSG